MPTVCGKGMCIPHMTMLMGGYKHLLDFLFKSAAAHSL